MVTKKTIKGKEDKNKIFVVVGIIKTFHDTLMVQEMKRFLFVRSYRDMYALLTRWTRMFVLNNILVLYYDVKEISHNK